MTTTRNVLAAVMVTVISLAGSQAKAFDLLRSKNKDVESGNTHLLKGDAKSAIADYARAKEKLPKEAGVSYNEGLAHLIAGDFENAQQSFSKALDLTRDKSLVADAAFDLGIALAQQGDAHANAEDFDAAISSFQDAQAALIRSLRNRPGYKNAAWNLEYVRRRIEELKQKKEEKEKEEQKNEQDKDDKENSDDQQDQNQDQDKDQNEQGENEKDGDKKDQQSPENQDDKEQAPQENQDQQDENDQQPGQQNQEQPTPSEQMDQRALQQYLDALDKNDKTLPLQQAGRGKIQNRQPEKDW